MTPRDKAVIMNATQALGLAASHRITEGVVATWSPLLHRAPRVLVPVEVDALLVPAGGGSWADCKIQDATQAPLGGNRQELAPAPFSTRTARDAGAYLHWALPSALTRGTAVTDAKNANSNTVNFPPIPDRWLVVRLFNQLGDTKRSITGWVLQAQGAAATAIDLGTWVEPGADSQASSYTAARFGNATWSAYFDNVENRLAFHDPLQGISRATVAYLVVGWYADETLDPLAGPFAQSPGDFRNTLLTNGWNLSRDDFNQAWRDAYDYAQSAHSLGLKVSRAPSSPNRPVDRGSEFTTVNGSRHGKTTVELPPAWPRQSLFHGSVVNLPWDTNAKQTVHLPNAKSLAVVIDRSTSEAMGTLLVAQSGNTEEARLLSAFQLGALDALDDAGGRARLEAGIHAATFRSFDGGRVAEHRLPNSKVTIPPAHDRHIHEESPKRPPHTNYETVYRGLPRWYAPHDPVLLVSGAGRSFKHGKDGRFESDGTLRCRLAPSCVSAVSTAAAGTAQAHATATGILSSALANGSIPVECTALLDELVLLDPASAPFMAAKATGASGVSVSELTSRFETEQTAWWNLRGRDFDPRALAAYSGIVGTVPSPIGVTPAHQPWEPRHLEWEVAYAPSSKGVSAWSLGELEYALADSRPATPITYRGRATLTGGAAETLAASARRAAELAVAAGAGGGSTSSTQSNSALSEALTDALATQADLKVLSDDLAHLDSVAGSLDGFLERLRDEPGGNIVTQSGDSYEDPNTVGANYQSLRAGTMQLTRLRLVDAWGQYIDLIDPTNHAHDSSLIIGAAMQSPLGTLPAATIVLPPRITAPSQLRFRFLSTTDDATEATEATSPVVGYLMPNHVEGSMEAFGAAGDAIGSVRPTDDDPPAIVWEPAPGTAAGVGASALAMAPGPIGGLMDALVTWGVADATSGGETALAALLRLIDSTRWTIDPYAHAGDEHLALLVGHPIAVVRASIEVVVRDTAVPAANQTTAFPVRLGALTEWQDGLFGFFVNDDYSTLIAVHAAAECARDVGPGSGFLGQAMDTEAYYQSFASDLSAGATAATPVTHPYVDGSGTVWLRPGERVTLTLLLEANTSVAATSGILPRKMLTLLREWTDAALQRMAPTFRFGPLLVEAKKLRMPVASDVNGAWTWSHRLTTTTWSSDPLVPGTADALVPQDPVTAQEGWLRLGPRSDGP